MNNSSTKNIIIGLIILAVIVAAVVIGSAKLGKRSPAPITQNQTDTTTGEAPKFDKKTVDSSKLPDKFPADIPSEQGAQILTNYNGSTPDGSTQATRSFVTAKTLAENLKIYTDYMKAKGWAVKATVNDETSKMVMGTKGDQQLQVTMSENSSSKEKTVTISLTQLSGN